MKKWLDRYADGGQTPARDNTTVYHNTLPIAGPKLPARTYISATPGYKDSEWYKQESEDYKTRRNITQPILHAADVTTDIMQLGRFIPLPQAQAIGTLGSELGLLIDSYQAADAYANNNYVNSGINAASTLIPLYMSRTKFLRDMHNTKPGSLADKIASYGNRSGTYLPLSGIRPNLIKNPVMRKAVNQNKKTLLGLAAETAYDSYAEGGESMNAGWLDRYDKGGPNLEDMKANFLQQYRPSPQADNTRLGSQRANVTNDQAQQLQKDAIRNAQRAAEERARLANARQTMDNESVPFTFPTGEKKKWADMDFKERNYVRGQSLRTKGRINEEGKETLLDYVNPLNWYGKMAASAAESPYMAKQTNSVMPYVMAAVEPLVAGRMMGSGSMNPFKGKFYTNSISDADFINHLGLGIPKPGVNLASKLPLESVPIINKASKLNPWAFNENPDLFYRQIFDKGNPTVYNKLKEKALKQNGKVLSAYQLGMSDEELTKQGLNLLTRPSSQTIFVEGVPVQTIITERPSEFPFFQKGKRYWKTNLSPSNELLIESKPNINDNFFPASIKHIAQDNFDAASKWSEGKYTLTGFAPTYSSENFNFYQPNWLKGYVPVNVNTESSVLPTLNADAISSNFENTKLGKALIGTNNLSTEFLGELLNGRKNRKGIKEGNQWLQNWINHPSTQAKIRTDMEKAMHKDFVTNNFVNKNADLLNLIENQSRNYKVNTKEYSLLQQLKDNIAQYRDINAREPIHLDNSGVSYEHAESPFYRDYVEKGGKPYKRYGNWISRAHFSNKANTTVHEGTHGWTSRNALEDSGLRDMSLENTNPEIKNDFYEWERLRNEGKSLKEIEKIMGKDRAFQAYIADPTEMHARTMELRKHFGIKPNEKFDVNDATKKLNKLSSLLKGNFKQPITGLKEYMNVIDNDPQKFANLLNNFWGLVPAGITIGALNNNSEPTNQYEYGGSIHNWREVEVPHKKNQLSGWLDKL
jgi:hypothetical protein